MARYEDLLYEFFSNRKPWRRRRYGSKGGFFLYDYVDEKRPSPFGSHAVLSGDFVTFRHAQMVPRRKVWAVGTFIDRHYSRRGVK